MPLPMPAIDESTPIGFQPIESGIYHATVTDYEEKEAKEGGKLPEGEVFVQFTFELTDENVSGKTLRQHVFFTEKSKAKLKEFLIGMGLTSEAITNMESFEASDYVGTECKVQVGLGRANEDGTRYNTIVRVLPLDDASDELPS